MGRRQNINGNLALDSKKVIVIEATKRPEEQKLRVAAYCRVSSDSSDQMNSFAAQLNYYTALISGKENWVMTDLYADAGISGTSAKKRPDFQRLLSDCRKGRIDKVLVKSISRFARNAADCLETIRELKSIGVGVYFEEQNIDTSNMTGELLTAMFSAIAQKESESISGNMRWSYQHRMKSGIFLPAAMPYGYRIQEKEIVVDEEQAEIVRRIFNSYLAGQSMDKIAEQLNRENVPVRIGLENRRWMHTAISYILSNERYIGDALLQKTYTTDCISKTVKKNQGERPMVYVEHNHPAIIPKEIFYQVREEMARRSSKRKVMQKTAKTEQGKYSAKYALSELLVCGECGTPYKRCTWARNGKKRIVWRCISRLEFGTDYCHSSPTLDENRLHKAIVGALNEYGAIRAEIKAGVLELASLAQSHREADGVSLLELKQRLDTLSTEQALLLDEILKDMNNPELNARLQALAEEKQGILDQMQALEKDESQRSLRSSRQREMEEWLDRQELRFTEYEDSVTRRFVERITVVDADAIQVKIRDVDVVIERKLC